MLPVVSIRFGCGCGYWPQTAFWMLNGKFRVSLMLLTREKITVTAVSLQPFFKIHGRSPTMAAMTVVNIGLPTQRLTHPGLKLRHVQMPQD